MKPYRVLTDEEWLAVAPLLPELQPRKETRGRPLTNTREVLNGVLWVMHSGSSWSMLPRRFPSYQTCHRRFKAWQRTGVLKHVLTRLFGPAGDEFHNAIVARMRNPLPDGAPEKPKRIEDVAAPTGSAHDRGWDGALLQNAFGAIASRAPLVAGEAVVELHGETLTARVPTLAEAASAMAACAPQSHEPIGAPHGAPEVAASGTPVSASARTGAYVAANPFRSVSPTVGGGTANRPWSGSADTAWANPMKSLAATTDPSSAAAPHACPDRSAAASHSSNDHSPTVCASTVPDRSGDCTADRSADCSADCAIDRTADRLADRSSAVASESASAPSPRDPADDEASSVP
ncbi:MAG TPA: transposase [Pararobbsia sp.]|nr:transposase [Pararobbsia sp.]